MLQTLATMLFKTRSISAFKCLLIYNMELFENSMTNYLILIEVNKIINLNK